LAEHALELLTNRPVRFRLFSSSDRVGDRPGQLLTLPADALAELPPMYTVLRFARSSHETALSVNLHARLTEIGTLELECVARATGNEQRDRWKLAFDLRGQGARHGLAADDAAPSAGGDLRQQADLHARAEATPSSVASEPSTPPRAATLDAAVGLLRALYG